VLGYTRRQLVMLIAIVAIGAAGIAVDRWRHANPDVVAYLEMLDRAPASAQSEAIARRAPARVPQSTPSSTTAPRGSVASRERARPRVDDTPIDVNLASAADLERLPGVGPALAARIVDLRARDGPFASIDDLRRVRGVGAATLERLRARLAVNTP
jgi:competence protein ComEA